jgi:hypothetical protein
VDGDAACSGIDELVSHQGAEVLAATSDNGDFVFQGMISHVDVL